MQCFWVLSTGPDESETLSKMEYPGELAGAEMFVDRNLSHSQHVVHRFAGNGFSRKGLSITPCLLPGTGLAVGSCADCTVGTAIETPLVL